MTETATAPSQNGQAEQQDVRSISPTNIIKALNASLDEKAQQIRQLEARVTMLQALIADQDEKISSLEKPKHEVIAKGE